MPISSQSPLRVLYCSTVELDIPGGPAVHTLNWVRALQRAGCEVCLVTPTARRIKLGNTGVRFRGLWFLGFRWWQLLLYDFVACWVVLWELIFFRPQFFLIRDMENNLLVPFLVRLFSVPLYLDVNGPLGIDLWLAEKKHAGRKSLAARLLRCWRNCWRRWILHVSRGSFYTQRRFQEKTVTDFGEAAEKTYFLSMYVDTDRFKPEPPEQAREKLGLDPLSIVIGYVGTFQPYHRIDILIQTHEWLMSQGINSDLLLVGSGNQREKYTAMAAASPFKDRIHFPGWVSHEKLPLYVNAMSIGSALVMPDAPGYSEALLKIKEYLACGVPLLLMDFDRFLFSEYPPECLYFIDSLAPELIGRKVQEAAVIRGTPAMDPTVKFVQGRFSLLMLGQETLQFIRRRG